MAAEALKLVAPDLIELGVIDEIVSEPVGGAHRDFDKTARIVKERIIHHLDELQKFGPEELVANRIEKYGKMGYYKE